MGQNERFERIYRETREELLRFLMIRTNADPEAEDLFQEVYRKFFVRLSSGVLPILDPKRYLYAIAKKELSRFYRRNARKKQTEQPIETCAETAATDEPIDERLLAEERKDAVWRLLQEEPELNRRAFLLFYGCELSQKEIGEALGIGEQAVRQRLYRTRQRIRALLESERDAF
ncbi:MAG: sigma-70 family RNA polymerase sigma factor [Clostridia bacterium]|nr:sigma-70 family RNA polymerase sigma factor [Clostridia bacterium]